MGLDQLKQTIITYVEKVEDEDALQNIVKVIDASNASVELDEEDLTDEQLASLQQAAKDALFGKSKGISIEEFKAKYKEWL